MKNICIKYSNTNCGRSKGVEFTEVTGSLGEISFLHFDCMIN